MAANRDLFPSRAHARGMRAHSAHRNPSEIDPQPAPYLLVQIAGEGGRRALGGDLAEAEHVDVVRHPHHPTHIVIDEQDRRAALGEELDPLVNILGDLRREPDRRFVDQAEARPPDPPPPTIVSLGRAISGPAGTWAAP